MRFGESAGPYTLEVTISLEEWRAICEIANEWIPIAIEEPDGSIRTLQDPMLIAAKQILGEEVAAKMAGHTVVFHEAPSGRAIPTGLERLRYL